eukprot:GHVT01093274.1.p1 GENE.GHVT01093274.1~~GHVT01093274.1.p1  ORF type:complete len:166 (-),score=27.82 GHVT01093274.1:663-1160(-)
MARRTILKLVHPIASKPVRTGGGYKLPATPVKKVKKGPIATRLPAAALAPCRRRAPMGRKKTRFSAVLKKTCQFEESAEEVQAKRSAARDARIMRPERRLESTILKKIKNPKVEGDLSLMFDCRSEAVARRLFLQQRRGAPIVSPVHEDQYFGRLEQLAMEIGED